MKGQLGANFTPFSWRKEAGLCVQRHVEACALGLDWLASLGMFYTCMIKMLACYVHMLIKSYCLVYSTYISALWRITARGQKFVIKSVTKNVTEKLRMWLQSLRLDHGSLRAGPCMKFAYWTMDLDVMSRMAGPGDPP